ncbi:MAG: hypothetical protein ACQEWG_06065 [Bacteroidota bacterium]
MNNETFGITFQYAICKKYELENNISLERISENTLLEIEKSGIIENLFGTSKPVEFLTFSQQYTSEFVKRCPHNFMLSNGNTFSIRTFSGKNKMFAPKIVGQSGDKTFNHYFGDLADEKIDRNNFKEFCLSRVHEILPVLIDYALVSDKTSWVYIDNHKQLIFKNILRENLPDLTFNRKDFSFTNETVSEWNETTTAKFLRKTIIEFQLHNNRSGFKIRLHRENFLDLLVTEKTYNNSVIGDSAELAVCETFLLDPGIDNDRLTNNSNSLIVKLFKTHYNRNRRELFPFSPIEYGGTSKRKRGGNSKSGIDFLLESGKSLSLKTNKNRSAKVCPPEIGQPSPKTFDHYFIQKGWYEGEMNEEKFRTLVLNREILSVLLSEYLKHLNECDYLLWSIYESGSVIQSKLIDQKFFQTLNFSPETISYSNDFQQKNSVTIRYGANQISLGEFQIHSARNSLKFRFHFGNLISMINS